MWVLRGESDDPQGAFRLVGKIATPSDRWAIDATVFEWKGKRYLAWSGWEDASGPAQSLYLAAMSDPTTPEGERVRISRPTHAWERHGHPINEGPQALVHEGRLHIVYSASGFWRAEYCLGLLTLRGEDPLDPKAWVKAPEPVYRASETVVGVGHGAFTTDDAGRWWHLHHAHGPRGADGRTRRDLRLQPFEFGPDGAPRFGEPIAPGVPIPRPHEADVERD
jgi:GH43 family beta-xylosidase